MTISDIINSVLLLITGIGVYEAYRQIRQGARAQRATFLIDLYMQLWTDPEVTKAFYEIEYGKFKFDKTFRSSELEPKIDRLLTLIDLVCEMHTQGQITEKEMRLFEYQFNRVVRNQGIQDYLNYLTKFYELNELNHKPFSAFQTYAKRVKPITNMPSSTPTEQDPSETSRDYYEVTKNDLDKMIDN